FIFIGYDPNSGIFKGQLATDAAGYVLIDQLMRTNVEGVFAAGEIHDSIFRQAITAAGQGCSAALIAIKWLQDRENQLQPISETEAVPAAGD
ncbi:MAG: NAD(P)/FAD-dependent oxidoreductase, partial [Anaerolineae bacterium]|nr:NAD(P)/FAD-dependent oxidoreductase [Anaerolineae bacterium]